MIPDKLHDNFTPIARKTMPPSTPSPARPAVAPAVARCRTAARSLGYLLTSCCVLMMGHAAAAGMPQVELNAGIHLIHAEVAASEADRSLGLMHRRALEPNHGMLFIFPAPDRHCMWMKNTLLPLTVAFLDDRGAVINLEDMKPQTLDTHCAASSAWFALEMSDHWFQQRGLGPGQVIEGVVPKRP